MDKSAQQHRRMDKHVTIKIWGVLLIFLCTGTGAFYWSYRNFQTLSASLEDLSRPGEKGDIINETFQEIIEAENHIHSYILTGDTLSRGLYRNKIAKVRTNIGELRSLLPGDTLQVKLVDTLAFIFDIKINYLEKFLYVKKLKQSSLFTSEAMNRIAIALNDTAFIDKQFLKREVLKGEVVPVVREEIVITPDEFKGVNGFLRKLFGRDNTKVDTVTKVENKTAYTYDVAVDTSIVRDYFRDSTLLAVKDILSLVMKKEISLQERLSVTEMRLLRQNKVFISKIRSVIEQLGDQERAMAAASKHASKEIAAESNRILFLIGFSGLLVSGILLFLILRDVTRAFHYRRQLEREKAKAEKLARVKEEFVAGMSHEIRTPLHNIMGFATLLKQTPLDLQQEEYMKAICESNTYLSELVSGILDQAKIDADKLSLAAEPFDFSRLAHELESVFSYTAQAKQIRFDVRITEALHDYRLIGDAFRIKQILNNLVSNAMKFTDKGSVTISADGKIDGDLFGLQIIVSDTGTGISEDKLNTIFEPFVQEKPGIAGSYGGTGLGLSITRGLVEAMKGSISVSNNTEGGATFTVLVTMPCISAADAAEEKEVRESPFFADAQVMVVEDDRWNAMLLHEILAPRVKSVQVFNDPVEALEYLTDQKNRTDLVFTDINMPGLPGDAFMERARLVGNSTPFIALTAHVQTTQFDHFRKIGFDHIIRKPFQQGDIEAILKLYFQHQLQSTPRYDALIPGDGESPASRNSNRLDFSLIRQFSGTDEAMFIRLIKELVQNNAHQVRDFAEFLRLKDAVKLAGLSHQMKTTYDHLKQHRISESLASIELLERMGNINRLLEIADDIIPELEAVLVELLGVTHRYHTA